MLQGAAEELLRCFMELCPLRRDKFSSRDIEGSSATVFFPGCRGLCGVGIIFSRFLATRFHLLANRLCCQHLVLFLFCLSDALYLILMQCFNSTPLSSSNKLFNLNFILFIPSQHIKWNQTVEFENVIYHVTVSSHLFLLFVCFF